MTYKTYSEKLNYLKQLVKHKATGSPSDLGIKLKISERTARRMISHLKD